MRIILTALMGLISIPAMAHPGSSEIHWHFLEHILLALAIGLPAIYGLVRLVKSPGKAD